MMMRLFKLSKFLLFNLHKTDLDSQSMMVSSSLKGIVLTSSDVHDEKNSGQYLAFRKPKIAKSLFA